MMLSEYLQRLANALGIEGAHGMNTRDLIHSIRLLEGELPCFSQVWSTPCRIEACPSGEECSSAQ